MIVLGTLISCGGFTSKIGEFALELGAEGDIFKGGFGKVTELVRLVQMMEQVFEADQAAVAR